MIIDCHTHLGRNEHIKASAKDLLHSMDEVFIDKSLVFAGELNDAPNEWVLEQIAPHKDRLLGVAAAHPMKYKRMSEVQDEVKRIVDWYGEGKIVACKFYTGYDHYYPQDKVIEEYLMELEDVGCPAIFHSGDCLSSVQCAKLKYAHPLHIDDVAVDYPKMNFIIAHMGFPWVRDTAEVCYKNSNVYADISGFVYGNFDYSSKKKFWKVMQDFVDISSYDKLLFGTDFPISNQKSYLDDTEYDTSRHYKKLSYNVAKVFKL
jgi:predicted TIM-barrel fold metal-dependent hydrolase